MTNLDCCWTIFSNIEGSGVLECYCFLHLKILRVNLLLRWSQLLIIIHPYCYLIGTYFAGYFLNKALAKCSLFPHNVWPTTLFILIPFYYFNGINISYYSLISSPYIYIILRQRKIDKIIFISFYMLVLLNILTG